MMTLLKWGVGALILFGGFVAFMYVAQRAMMYFPETTRVPPADAGLAGAEEVVLKASDGEQIIVWHLPPRGDKPVVLYFHGNGGSLRYRVDRFRALTADGTGLIALSYRGYGGSSGSPTEPGLIADAMAAYDFAAARYAPSRIVLWGESLGTGVAVALAAERPVARIVLEAPFSSAADVGMRAYPFLPVRLLMKDQFRSDERIARINVPILILHGALDRVVPMALGERLYGLANEPRQMVRFPNGDHNDLDSHGAQAVAREFIAQAR
jgi:fermentation-respiration switch protein FrsA (DUF1100 family)